MKAAKIKRVIALMIPGIWLSQCIAGTDEEARFQRDYPEAARRLESRLSKINGTCLMTSRQEKQGERSTKGTFAVDRGRGKISVLSTATPKRGPLEVVTCFDGESAFCIYRKPGEPDYTVMWAGKAERLLYDDMFGNFIVAPYSILGAPLSRIMRNPTFHILSAIELKVDRRLCLEIQYEIVEDEIKKTVTVVLDPNAEWVIRRAEVRSANSPDQTIAQAIDYGSTLGASPTPLKVEFSHLRTPSKGVDSKATSISSCKFESMSFSPTPDQEFMMSHYGLPDVTRAQEGSGQSQAALWLIVIAALGLLVAVALRRLSRRFK